LGLQADLPTVHISCDWEHPVPLRRNATPKKEKTTKLGQINQCVGNGSRDNE